MPSRRGGSRDRGVHEKKEPNAHKDDKDSKVKIVDVVDLEDDDAALVQVKEETQIVKRVKEKKDKDKGKTKKEQDRDRDNDRDKEKSKAKKEKDRSRSRHKEEKGRKRRSESRKRPARRSASRKRSRSGSGSSSSDSSSSSTGDAYRKFKPYTKVRLRNLVRKAELNGATGSVVNPGLAVSPCPPGCLIVRLDTGREIAVKPPNVQHLRAFHQAPPPVSQEERLQQVVRQIRLNVDSVMDRTHQIRDGGSGSLAITDEGNTVRGGMGHFL